jgi:hypothetical protein
MHILTNCIYFWKAHIVNTFWRKCYRHLRWGILFVFILIRKFRNINVLNHLMINDQYKLDIVDRLVNCKTIKCNYVHYFMIISKKKLYQIKTFNLFLVMEFTSWKYLIPFKSYTYKLLKNTCPGFKRLKVLIWYNFFFKYWHLIP